MNYKKKIGALSLTLAIVLLFLLSACATAPALNQSIEHMESDLDTESIYAGTCTRGNTACEYPGDCGQYIDQNGDGLCDR